MGIINFEDLKKNSKRIKENERRKIKIHVNELGGDMIFNLVSSKEFVDMLEEDYHNKDALLIYNSCVEPNLKNEKFIKEMGCNADPYDVVEKILTQATILEISEMILKESELKIKEKSLIELVADDIKN